MIRVLAVLLALSATAAGAAVTYTVTLHSSAYAFDATAAVTVPRYLSLPINPPPYRSYEFLPAQLDYCIITQGYQCTGMNLSYGPYFGGGNAATAAIGSSYLGDLGIALPGVDLKSNGTFDGSLGSTSGTLIISGSPTIVPEPVTWLMMVSGFAMIGAALRGRAKREPLRLTL